MSTVHLIKSSDLKDFNPEEDIPTIQQLEHSYPGIKDDLKRGDIIEDIDESGYRSDGVYMYDGSEVISQNYDYDSYGSPSTEFKAITEFPPDYWTKHLNGDHKLNINKKWVGKVYDSQFYWHYEDPPVTLDLSKFEVVKVSNDYWILLDSDRKEYHIVYIDPSIHTYYLDHDLDEMTRLMVWSGDGKNSPEVSKNIVGNLKLGYVVTTY